MDIKRVAPWELLQKNMAWEQLSSVHHKRVLDFGSGNGMTADHFAIDNEVIAVEPNEIMIRDRFFENSYTQIRGDIESLKHFEDESFDVILCHNVLEYADEREQILDAFSRLLRKNGLLSVMKHNRAGRVMQMVVLLNNFAHAEELLAGKNGYAQQFGAIHYYEDHELLGWSHAFEVERVFGIRTFWDLQQNQEVHKDKAWQQQMLDIELKVSEIEEYRAIASFHHVILRKKQ